MIDTNRFFRCYAKVYFLSHWLLNRNIWTGCHYECSLRWLTETPRLVTSSKFLYTIDKEARGAACTIYWYSYFILWTYIFLLSTIQLFDLFTFHLAHSQQAEFHLKWWINPKWRQLLAILLLISYSAFVFGSNVQWENIVTYSL